MSRSKTDKILVGSTATCGLIAAAIVGLILLFLALESIPALRHIGVTRFLSDPSWTPTPDAPNGSYNIAPMLIGSCLVTLMAVAVAAPLGLLNAVFLHFFAPRALAGALRRAITLMAAVPSVVYGLWGLVALVPLIRALHPPGPSLLAASAVLVLMILPTVALSADTAFTSIPRQYLLGAQVLGMDRWSTLRGVIFPAARSAVVTGAILQTARAIGETMAVLMVCGNLVKVPTSIFDPFRALTANIALEMAYALGDHRSALFVSGLALMLLVSLLVLAVHSINSHGRPNRA